MSQWAWRNAWLEDESLPPMAKLVLHTLMTLPSIKQGSAHPGVPWIARAASISSKTARRALAAAVESGWLGERKRVGATSVYALAHPTHRVHPTPDTESTPPGLSGTPPREGPLPLESTHPTPVSPPPPPTESTNTRKQGLKEAAAAAAAAIPSEFSEEERRTAAEEVWNRRKDSDSTWEPATTRARYLRGILRDLPDEEVSELLQGAEARRDRAHLVIAQMRAQGGRLRASNGYSDSYLASIGKTNGESP